LSRADVVAENGQSGSKWDALQRYGSTAIRYIRVQNVLSALVLVTIIVGVLALCALPFLKGVLAYIVVGLPVACVLNLFAAFWYFAITDPERLQNEEHIERMAEVSVATMHEGEVRDPEQRAIIETPVAPSDELSVSGDPPDALIVDEGEHDGE